MSALDLPILVDAKTGSIWGDSTVQGQSCTDACQADGGKECDATAFDEMDSQATFDEASSMTCEGGYESWGSGSVPHKYTSTKKCWYGTGGTCGASDSTYTRVCPCKCGAGTYQPSTGIALTCIR